MQTAFLLSRGHAKMARTFYHIKHINFILLLCKALNNKMNRGSSHRRGRRAGEKPGYTCLNFLVCFHGNSWPLLPWQQLTSTIMGGVNKRHKMCFVLSWCHTNKLWRMLTLDDHVIPADTGWRQGTSWTRQRARSHAHDQSNRGNPQTRADVQQVKYWTFCEVGVFLKKILCQKHRILKRKLKWKWWLPLCLIHPSVHFLLSNRVSGNQQRM